jgi:2'-5' RNA ligase
VTLARLKRSYDARKWLRPELTEGVAPCQVTHLTLYRSHLRPEGAEYVPLARAAFA